MQFLDQAIRRLTPPRLVLGSFASLILLGAGLLSLPALQGAGLVSWLDCLFTATSAVCVTGLITVDTASAWSALGQGVILALIQLGGLGIMTFSVALLYLSGRRPSLQSHLALKGALGAVPAQEMGQVTRDVLLYTLLWEAAGALVLFFRFVSVFSPGRAAALAVFHSVSAFCNAGFSLFSNSLEGFAGDWVVNATVIVLIMAGGIGFLVLRELTQRLRRGKKRRPRLSLNSRLALLTSLWLVVGGALLLAGFEYLADGGRAWGGNLWAPLFTAVTPRTAGFNTVPLTGLSNASLLLIMMLMFVGASPGSCGGGLKTTTLAVLFAMVRTRLRRRQGAEIGRRSIPETQVTSALLIVIGSLLLVVAATMLLVSLQLPDQFLDHKRGELMTLAFEAFSAFGTVGLSLGETPNLTPWGKVIIIALMFIGRLGPLTFIYALGQRAVDSRYRLAEERVMLG